MTGSTIDLGVLPPAGQDDGPPPPPAPASGWPRRPVAWVAGVLGVLLLLTATASVPPRPPWAVPVFTVPAGEYVEQGGFTLTQDVLYVHGWAPDEQQTLSAYRLSDGTLLWQQAAQSANAWQGKPVLWDNTDESGHTVLLDPETGEPRWRGRGDLAAVVGDRLLFTRMRPDGTPITDGDSLRWPEELTAIDRQTSQEVWTLPAVEGWAYVASEAGRPGRLVTVDDERLSSYDLGTGALLATAEQPDLRPSWGPRVVGDVVLVLQGQRRPQLYAYHLRTLSRLWTMEFDSALWGLTRCGDLVCVLNDRGLRALDPVTGEQRWSGPWLPAEASEPEWLAGHVLVTDPSETYPQDVHVLIDGATGEVVLELGEWQPHDGDGPAGLVTRYDPDRQPVVVQLDANRREIRFHEAGRTWFARVHPDPPRLEVLGFVAGGVDGCGVTAGYLACESGDTVQVWRIGAAP